MSLDREAAAALFATTVRRPNPPRRRPVVVIVACVFVVGWGATEAVSAAGALLVSRIGERVPKGEMVGVIGWMFERFVELAACQLICGILTITFGIGLWAGWSWARRASQIVMAFWAVGVVVLAVAMASTAPIASTEPLVTGFLVFWRASALVAGLIWAALLVLPVWLLEKQEARSWFRERAGRR
jgi:hypothetical protein